MMLAVRQSSSYDAENGDNKTVYVKEAVAHCKCDSPAFTGLQVKDTLSNEST